MANRLFILPFFGLLLLFLFAFASNEPNSQISSPPNWHDISVHLESLKVDLYRMEETKEYDSLITLKPRFQLDLHSAPDSIRSPYRSLCMIYAFLHGRKLNDYWNALTYYLIAHENVKDLHHLDELSWFIENEISTIYTRHGDFEKSEYYAKLTESSLKYFHKYEQLSRLYTNMGINQYSLGNNVEAMRILNEGYRIADSLQYPAGIFSNSLGIAEIYLSLAQDSMAGMYLRKAESNLKNLIEDSRYPEKKSGLESAFGKYYELQGDSQKSIANYRSAIQTLYSHLHTTVHRDFAKLYIPLAEAYLLFQKNDSVQACIDLGLKSLLPEYNGRLENLDTIQLYKENSFVDIAEIQHNFYKQTYLTTKDTSLLTKAYSCIKKGLFVNDQLRSDLILDPSKLTAIRYNKRLTNYGIETLYTLYNIHPNPKYLKNIRELFTRSKSILYNEKIRAQAMTLHLSTSKKVTRDSIEYAMLSLLDKKYEEHAQFDAINSELIRLQERLNEITKPYRETSHQVIPLDEYIEYVQTDSSLFAYSEFDGHPQIVQLGSVRELNNLVSRMNEFVTLKEVSSDEKVCRDLYDFLVAPLKIRPTNKFVIIPDGQVSLVPFELLQETEGKYLIEKTTISYEYQYDPYVLQNVHLNKSTYIFCLAPQYHLPSPVQASRGGLYELPFAKNEVDQVGRILGKQAHISDDSDKGKCIDGIKNSRIFHYSGHAIVKPEAAYLALSDQPGLDHQLTDQEITLMSNPMDMVVLSACETGLGKWEYGEGIRSLGRSFMEAGAGATIYSLWSVNDQSTAEIMSNFYRNIKKGCRKDEALRKAKLEFLRKSKAPYNHPYHWAAFIASGDMKPLNKSFQHWMLIFGLFLVLSTVLWIINKKRKNLLLN